MGTWWFSGVISYILVFCSVAFGNGPVEVDLAMVIATDVSSSIKTNENGVNEIEVQKMGLVSALLSPQVSRLLEQCSGGRGIALTYVEWSGDEQVRQTHQVVGWRQLRSRADLISFAEAVRASPLRAFNAFTDLYNAIRFSRELLSTTHFVSDRRMILVSGDGKHSIFQAEGSRGWAPRPTPDGDPLVLEARNEAVQEDISLAALAIDHEPPLPGDEDSVPLDEYFRINVQGGPFGFVARISSFQEYSRAMEDSLTRILNSCRW